MGNFHGGHDRARICDCLGMAPSRSSGGNSVVGRPEFCAGQYVLLFVWIYAVRFYSADSANVAAVVRIHGNGCGIGAGARGICDRDARAASSTNTAQDWREMADRFRLFGLRAGYVVLRELHFSHGLSP